MDLLVRWLVTAVAIFLVPHLVEGVHVPGFPAALTMSAVLGVLNLLVKPILVLLTLPLTMLSLGFFYLVLNALLFEWAGQLVQGVTVASFRDAFLASLIVSVLTWATHFRRGGQRRFVFVNTAARGPQPQSRPRPANRSGRPLPDDETIELHEKDSGKWE